MTNVAAVIVNWNNAALTMRAVGSVRNQSYPSRHIFIVDNGSDDESAEFLAEKTAPDPDLTLVKLETNGGFGTGCNAAIRMISSTDFDLVWLLNNDAVADEECLHQLVDCFKSKGKIGGVGSILYDSNKPNADHFGSKFNPVSMATSPLRKVEELTVSKYSWVTAASVLLSRSALEEVGLFDERYFMYWEDADMAMRLRKAGYSLTVSEMARVKHIAGTSSDAIPVQRYLWHYESQMHWIAKHHPLPQVAKVLLAIKYVVKAALDQDRERLKALLRRIF